MGGAATACPSCRRPLALGPGRAGRAVRCPHCGAQFDAPPQEGGAVEFFDALPAPTVTGRNPRPGESIFDDSALADGDQPTQRLGAPAPPHQVGEPPRTTRLTPPRPPPPGWVRPIFVGLTAYALLATALAAWGWLR